MKPVPILLLKWQLQIVAPKERDNLHRFPTSDTKLSSRNKKKCILRYKNWFDLKRLPITWFSTHVCGFKKIRKNQPKNSNNNKITMTKAIRLKQLVPTNYSMATFLFSDSSAPAYQSTPTHTDSHTLAHVWTNWSWACSESEKTGASWLLGSALRSA